MNHDYTHCLDFTEQCPKSCFRAQLARDLKVNPQPFVSFAHLAKAEKCGMKEVSK